MTRTRWRILFSGKVQHVGFRYTAYYLARGLELTGWVMNLPDGSVLMEAQGSAPKLRKLLIRLKSQPHIHIEKAVLTEIPPEAKEAGFRVKSGR